TAVAGAAGGFRLVGGKGVRGGLWLLSVEVVDRVVSHTHTLVSTYHISQNSFLVISNSNDVVQDNDCYPVPLPGWPDLTPAPPPRPRVRRADATADKLPIDRKSTRLNSSHVKIS